MHTPLGMMCMCTCVWCVRVGVRVFVCVYVYMCVHPRPLGRSAVTEHGQRGRLTGLMEEANRLTWGLISYIGHHAVPIEAQTPPQHSLMSVGFGFFCTAISFPMGSMSAVTKGHL